MGRDLTLYPKKASRDDLRRYLESLGFERCSHLWDWPKGTLNYSWFDEVDFKSIDGVSADIYPISEDELQISGSQWALHVRNRYSASWFDVKMLNEVLRGARKQFGGTIKGDYGTNRYAPLWKDESTPISRGITFIYQHVAHQISSVKHALPDATIQIPARSSEKIDGFADSINSTDPSRVIYNGLVPFAVAMFEFFFAEAFQILIAYDEGAQIKLRSHRQKVEFEDLLHLQRNEKTIEQIIAENYTFQNLAQLNKAYKDWLQIDVRALLYKRQKIGASTRFLENQIADIIQYRHGLVHHFSIDRSLTKERFVHILDAIEAAIDEFVMYVEQKYQVQVERY